MKGGCLFGDLVVDFGLENVGTLQVTQWGGATSHEILEMVFPHLHAEMSELVKPEVDPPSDPERVPPAPNSSETGRERSGEGRGSGKRGPTSAARSGRAAARQRR